jgi:hypothetical protein
MFAKRGKRGGKGENGQKGRRDGNWEIKGESE